MDRHGPGGGVELVASFSMFCIYRRERGERGGREVPFLPLPPPSPSPTRPSQPRAPLINRLLYNQAFSELRGGRGRVGGGGTERADFTETSSVTCRCF